MSHRGHHYGSQPCHGQHSLSLVLLGHQYATRLDFGRLPSYSVEDVPLTPRSNGDVTLPPCSAEDFAPPFATQRTLLPLLLCGEPCSPLWLHRGLRSPLWLHGEPCSSLWLCLGLQSPHWLLGRCCSPLWLCLKLRSPTGFMVVIALFLCSALDIAPPFSYVEMPYGVCRVHTEDIAPNEPCWPKGPYQLRDKYGA